MTRPSPSKKDRRGVKRRRARVDAPPSLLGTIIVVPTRADGLGSYFSALTHVEYDDRIDDPRRFNFAGRSLKPQGAAGRRAALRAVEPVEVLCRCERQLVRITRGLADSGYQPRCNPSCEARRRKAKG